MSANHDTLANVTATTQLARQFVDMFWNRRQADAVDTLLLPAYVDHAYEPANREGLVAVLAQLSSSFPDHRHTIEAQVAQDDLVVLRMRLQATHLGDFRGTPPAGHPIDVSVYRMYRILEGRIAEHWALLDTTTLLRQIGATPAPLNAGAR